MQAAPADQPTDAQSATDQTQRKRKYGAARMKVKKQDSVFGNQDNDGPNNILRNAGSKLGASYYQREIDELQRQIRNYKLYYCFVAAYNALSRLFLVQIQFIALSDYNNQDPGFSNWYMWYIVGSYSLPAILKPVFAWYSERFFPFRYRIKGYALVISILNIIIMSTVHFTSSVRVFEIGMQLSSISVLMLDAIAQGMTTTTIAMEKRLLQKLHPFTPIRKRKYQLGRLQVIETTSDAMMESANQARQELPLNLDRKPSQNFDDFLSQQPSATQMSTDSLTKKEATYIWEPSHTSNYAQYLAVFHLFAYIFTFASYYLFIHILNKNPEHKASMKDFQKFTPALYISISFSAVLLVSTLCFRELRRDSWVEKNPPQIDLRFIGRSLFTGQQGRLVWLVGALTANPLNFVFAKVMLESFELMDDGATLTGTLTLTLPILMAGVVVAAVLLGLRNSVRFSGVASFGGLMIVTQGVVLLLMFAFAMRSHIGFLTSHSMVGVYLLGSAIVMEGIGGLGKLCLVERFTPGAPKGYSVFLVNLVSAIVTFGLWLSRILIFLQSELLFDKSELQKGFIESLGLDAIFWVFCIMLLYFYKKKQIENPDKRRASEVAYDWKQLVLPSSSTSAGDGAEGSREDRPSTSADESGKISEQINIVAE